MAALIDTNILTYGPLPSPAELCDRVAINPREAQLVAQSRKEIANILLGRDPRLLAIVGPCS
ncbi:MAG TPA: 3-deoxy-7-phosphoheptulonate synthase, partial [Opitutales bacterium]|nr:3-deoxy-7-phosphoheptulonate synthase [Opitutales bacterium]